MRTIHRRTAMAENPKIQILANDVVRRFLNCSEDTPTGELRMIVDKYAQKIVNGGFSVEQARRIIVAGIKGNRSKLDRWKKEGRRVRRTCKDSLGARVRSKLLGKTHWYRKRRKESEIATRCNGKGGVQKKKPYKAAQTAPRTILFVEQTPMGGLAIKMRELLTRLEPILGFRVKVVEKCGTSLKGSFPLASLWDGAKCGRGDCITCEQEAEVPLPPCTKPGVIYENMCRKCNPTAGGKEELKEIKEGEPSIYIGESSRSIKERSSEHWRGWRRKKEDNHIFKHQEMIHPQTEPDFIMRAVHYPRSALERQLGEAVRIRRRGGEGSILNSRSEYNRCYVPRLRLEKKEEWEERARELERMDESKSRALDGEEEDWSKAKVRKKTLGELHSKQSKRAPEEEGPRKTGKRRKYELLGEDWGENREGASATGGREVGGQPTISQTTTLPTSKMSAPPTPTPPTPPDVNGVDCSFSRGICMKHNVRGVRKVSKIKKWGLLKTKIYGWIHTQKVTYTCTFRDLETSLDQVRQILKPKPPTQEFSMPGEGD